MNECKLIIETRLMLARKRIGDGADKLMALFIYLFFYPHILSKLKFTRNSFVLIYDQT